MQSAQQEAEMPAQKSSSIEANLEEAKINLDCIPDDFVYYSKDMMPATLWTRSEISAFKEKVSIDHTKVIESSITMLPVGKSLSIQISTKPGKTAINWDFCTESGDVSFGLYFNEAEVAHPNKNVLKTISFEEGFNRELMGHPVKKVAPIRRLDAGDRVFGGEHSYPTNGGTYCFVFDNSFTTWDSKKIFFRFEHIGQ